jgi:hypothetical protein
MALVTDIKQIEKTGQPHDPCECSYFVVETKDGNRLLTLETYGRDSRKMPGKISQSIQFGEQGAKRLRELLDQVFPNSK